MFKRRKKHGLLRQTREALWPSIGWGRAYHYWRHRIFRNGDSTYRITAGLATGAAVSFSPLLGTHLLQALLFAWILRANWLAALAGTVWGNPWTFPAMFWISYHLGAWLFGLFGLTAWITVPERLSIGNIFSEPLGVFLPWMVGGYVCAILFWPLAYAVLYFPVRSARRLYRARRVSKLRRGRQADPVIDNDDDNDDKTPVNKSAGAG